MKLYQMEFHDNHDLLTTVGRTVKLYNLTEGIYEDCVTTINADGMYRLSDVVIGPEYRVEFSYNDQEEIPSIIASNKAIKCKENTLGYSFSSQGIMEGADYMVDAAVVGNGTINIKFSTDGINTVGVQKNLKRTLPTVYTATVGLKEAFSDINKGFFVVPEGYRLMPGESVNKTVSIDATTKSQDIIFLVELIKPNLIGEKKSKASSENLHPGDTITYTIKVNNFSSQSMDNILITDQIPEYTEFVGASQGGNVTQSGEIHWVIDILSGNGGSKEVSFTVKILPHKNLGQWNIINDQAQINNIPINSTIDSATQSLLESNKTSDIAENQHIKQGDIITYTINTANRGADSTGLVTITDIIPEGTTLIENSQSLGATIDENSITLSKERLAPGESLNLSFKVRVN